MRPARCGDLFAPEKGNPKIATIGGDAMKAIRLVGFAQAVLALSLMSLPALAQAQQDSQQPRQANSAQSEQQAQAFMGKIARSKEGYILKDEASNTTYKLDNEDQAKQYVGKKVKVTGTLDPETGTIHVVSIEAGS
jgi:streptogramin lyase